MSELSPYLDSKADMAKAAKIIVEYCAAVKAGEHVIVASDDCQSTNVYQSILNAAACADADASLLVFPTPEWEVPGAWIQTPKSLLSVAKEAECIIYCGKRHISRDLYDLIEFKRKDARLLMVQGMSEDSIIRTTPTNYSRIVEECDKLIELFNKSKSAKITSPNGTEMTVDLHDSTSAMARGTFKLHTSAVPHSGKIEFLPAGRTGTFFVNKPLNGTIVIDGFLGIGICKGNVEIQVEGGRVTKVKGRNGVEQWYVDTIRNLFKLDENASHVGELGLGTHPEARLVGSYEDYGVRGSIRFGFGTSRSLSGKTIKSILHTDCFIMGGDMELDGKTVVNNGELQIPN